jgi:hypothetical protein
MNDSNDGQKKRQPSLSLKRKKVIAPTEEAEGTEGALPIIPKKRNVDESAAF